MNEFEIITKYFRPLTKANKAAAGLQDDAAIVMVDNKKELLISKDLMVQDVHFRIEDGAYNIAGKLLRSNLSDLAASGAQPLYYMLGFAQHLHFDEKFIKEFCRGLKDVGEEFGAVLIGGDSVRCQDKLFFSLTIFGQTKKGQSLKRNAAKNGDLIFVSGDIGDAFLGLQILQNKIICKNKTHQKYLAQRHLAPSPRINLGLELVKQNLSKAAIDISDGLLADLLHICQTSKVDALIWQDLIPLSRAAKYCLKNHPKLTINQLLSGGEDYELIFTAKKENHHQIMNLAQKIGVKISCIGHLQKAQNVPKIQLLDQKNQKIKIENYGWQHY